MSASNTIQRVHRINRPLVVGETVLVPCTYLKGFPSRDHDGTPVLWPPHGQPEVGIERHTHVDTRFADLHWMHSDRWEEVEVQWRPLTVRRSQPTRPTANGVQDSELSAMRCQALVNGRCPHKGFNMQQITLDEHGELRCPMHGMRFDPATGSLISAPYQVPVYDRRQTPSTP